MSDFRNGATDRPWYKNVAYIIHENRINVLLVFVPVGLVCGYLALGPLVVFWTNFVAIMPLAAVLSYSTELLAETEGPAIGGLLNASLGNVVELIIAIAALRRGEIRIVQTSMLGSIFSNLLLVLGCSFVAGGYNRLQQTFNQTAAQTMASLMTVACISLLIPAAYTLSVPRVLQTQVIEFSRWTSLVLLTIYALYLVFQLKTHRQFFETLEAEAEAGQPPLEAVPRNQCLFLLALSTLLVALNAEYLVGSIEGLVSKTGLTKTFIGLILLPIVGNAAEHVTAIAAAMNNNTDLAMSVALGSSLQISLFMTPFLVVLGWLMNEPMSLYFHQFETAVMFVSVFLANNLIQDGESNWLEGVLLIGVYIIIATAFYFYPDDSSSTIIVAKALLAS